MDPLEAVSLPESSAGTGHRYFSVAQANRALVLVRRVVTDIVRDYRKLCAIHDAYQNHDAQGNVVLAEEARQHYVRLTDHLSELRDELEEIGCDLKDYDQGLVDFPALHEGKEILLCWRLGEASVEHWHELDAGFNGRRPLLERS